MKKLGIGCLGLFGILIFLGIIGALFGKSSSSTSTVPSQATTSDAARPSSNQAKAGTRENPVPFGQALVITDRNNQYEVSVVSAQRMDEAAIKRINQFNSGPQSGNEYLFVKIHFRYVSGADAYKTPSSGASVLYQGRMWGEKIVVGPEPKFAGIDLYAGGEAEGWISALEIPTGASPLVLNWGQGMLGGGGNWFELPPDA